MVQHSNLIYLAQPIDMGGVEPHLPDYVMGELQALNLTIYDPKSAFSASGPPHGLISKVNQGAMEAATGAVAFLPKDVQSVGVPAEISYLTAVGKPVAILSDHIASWVVSGWRDEFYSEVFELSESGASTAIDWLTDKLHLTNSMRAMEPEVDPIVFERKSDTALLPTRGYSTDAGYDLYSSEDVVIPAGGQAIVPLGVAVDIPEGLYGQITGRSSTLQKLSLMVAPTAGIIDEGYTGELFAPVVSFNSEDVKVEAGQRIAQLILHEAPGPNFRPVWGYTRLKDRGANGFGSTGK